MLEAWGSIVYHVRWPLLVLSIVLLALSAWLVVQGGELQDPGSLNSSESGRASALINSDQSGTTAIM